MGASTIDWGAIHRRLAVAEVVISGGLDRNPEDVRRVLEARARTAAKPPTEPDDTERLEVLVFSLSGETYAVETCHVREVCRLKDLTALPCTPPFVAGVMNRRGQIVAILDLRRFFELPSTSLTELNQVIVLSGGGHEFGLLADSIMGTQIVAAADLQENLPTLIGIRDRFLKGVTSQMLAVLDGGRLLTDAGLKVEEHVAR